MGRRHTRRRPSPITRKEEGCLLYDLHQDNEDPAHFMFYETWESRELWQAHMDAPHLAAYMKATDGMVAELTHHEMTKIAWTRPPMSALEDALRSPSYLEDMEEAYR